MSGVKTKYASLGLGLLGVGLLFTNTLRGEYLFDQFIDPLFTGPNSEYSQWDVFGNPGDSFYNVSRLPDSAIPALTPPTIVQTIPGAIIGSTDGNWGDNYGAAPPTGGNVYSYMSPLSFIIDDQTHYGLTTVVFQFQTAGNYLDIANIRLAINGQTFYATDANAEYIMEWAGGSTSFAGLDNRVAIQWDLSSLNLTGPTSYQIHFDAPQHTSFQRALLDTTGDPYKQVVAEARTWSQGGSNLSWNTASNWHEGSPPSMSRGNIKFANTSTATINLDGNREVAELIFKGTDVTINGSGSQTLTSNSGININGTGGTYTINSNFRFGSTNMMNIQTGSTVRINGVISGNFGGLIKEGGGVLDLTNNNTFTATAAGTVASVEVYDGILRLAGSNQYSGTTNVLFGRLIVAANSFQGSGALGTSTTNVTLGASGFFTGTSETVAEIYLEGDVTMARNISLSENQTIKTLGAMATTNGANYIGNISIGNSSNANFVAEASNDTATFSGYINGGSNVYAGGVAGAVTEVNIGGQGTVVFTGNEKTYTGNTTVQSEAHLKLNTTLAGTGDFNMSSGKLSGNGLLKKNLMVDTGDIISPGDGVGRFRVGDASALQQVTFGSGGKYEWQLANASGVAGTDWDYLDISGTLNISSNEANRFNISLMSFANTTFDPYSDYDWVILNASSGINNFNSEAFQIDASAFDLEILGTFSLVQNNNDLVLRYVYVVPEPGKTFLLLIGGIAAGFSRRRKHKQPV